MVILFPVFFVTPAKAGVGLNSAECNEAKTENIIQRKVKKFQDPIPAFAGMTRENTGMIKGVWGYSINFPFSHF